MGCWDLDGRSENVSIPSIAFKPPDELNLRTCRECQDSMVRD
jgi:hypothetical protein